MRLSPSLSSIHRKPANPGYFLCQRPRPISSSIRPQNGDVEGAASRPSRLQHGQGRSKVAERDFFLSVLSATATKRDAKAYLSRFALSKQGKDQSVSRSSNHVALVKIRSTQSLSDSVIHGFVNTISQLNRLGLGCVIVVDCDSDISNLTVQDSIENRKLAFEQADRLVSALESIASTNPFRLDDLLGITTTTQQNASVVQIRGPVEVRYPDLLIRPLRRGVIPIITPVAFTEDTQRIQYVNADDVVLALAREFAGLTSPWQTSEVAERVSPMEKQSMHQSTRDFVLDRLIILDPLGPIPSPSRTDQAHVFINLEQEYDDIRSDLQAASSSDTPKQCSSTSATMYPRHIRNLNLLRQTLALLPPSSSAFLTTPLAAATLSTTSESDSAPGVGTRRPKNPLIFNLLTDKPLISSSLPVARLGADIDSQTHASTPPSLATFAKRGMPLTIIPNPKAKSWQPPRNYESPLTLKDSQIDLPRLLTLIEDSFNRTLDVQHYLERIQGKLAGIIVAGEYEGGSILTWELPPGVPDDGSESSRQRMVPYLDKFAVLKRSQGAGGHADILFSAMVRTCFPHGVCWRSRKDNPVNKWYFERAVGTWKLPGTQWTMFWTDNDLSRDSQRFRDYESVCRSILPSWADNKGVVE